MMRLFSLLILLILAPPAPAAPVVWGYWIGAGGPVIAASRPVPIPEGDIELVLGAMPQALDDRYLPVVKSERSPKARTRPATPGLSVGHPGVTAGTFGAVVYRNGLEFLLSNNHVICNSNTGDPGDPVLQPGVFDGGKPADAIAKLTECATIQFWTGRGETHNHVDAAVAKLIPGMARPEVANIGKVTGTTLAYIGQVVCISGRTSGYECGKVVGLHADVHVGYGHGRTAYYTDQIVLSPVLQGGDSGSLVLDGNRAVCLGFAGSSRYSFCNPINLILDEFSVSLSP